MFTLYYNIIKLPMGKRYVKKHPEEYDTVIDSWGIGGAVRYLSLDVAVLSLVVICKLIF